MRYIIADKRMPAIAANKLSVFGEVLFLETRGITYDAISGHPDIFITQTAQKLIVAPNIPIEFQYILQNKNIQFQIGSKAIGSTYPETSYYNALADDDILLHNLEYTDSVILNSCTNLHQISVNQSYTRCNCISLGNNSYITSDKGIEKTLLFHGFEVLFINPEQIVLEGFSHGFIGGCCGIYENTMLICGNPDFIQQGNALREFVKSRGFNIHELYDGPFIDIGSLIIV
jgi:hypothetical protein